MAKKKTQSCSFMEGKTGYKGQRYEVWAKDGSGFDFPVGWTNSPDGGGLRRMIESHPSWHSPRVLDLKKRDLKS